MVFTKRFFRKSSLEVRSKGGGTGPGDSKSDQWQPRSWGLFPVPFPPSIVRSHEWFIRVPYIKDARTLTEWMAPVGPE